MKTKITEKPQVPSALNTWVMERSVIDYALADMLCFCCACCLASNNILIFFFLLSSNREVTRSTGRMLQQAEVATQQMQETLRYFLLRALAPSSSLSLSLCFTLSYSFSPSSFFPPSSVASLVPLSLSPLSFDFDKQLTC